MISLNKSDLTRSFDKNLIDRQNLSSALAWAAENNVAFDIALESHFGEPYKHLTRMKGVKLSFKTAIDFVIEDLRAGFSLSNALKESCSQWLPTYYLDAISLAEEQGTLSETLILLSDSCTRIATRKRAIRNMLYYPLLLISICIAGCFFLTVYIFPKLLRIMEDLTPHANPPDSLMFIYSLNKLQIDMGFLGMIAILQLPILIYYAFFTDKLEKFFVWFPYINRPILHYNKMEALIAMRTYLQLGMSEAVAFELVIDSLKDSLTKFQFKHILTKIEDGLSFEQAWAKTYPKEHLENFFIDNGVKNNSLLNNIESLINHKEEIASMRFKRVATFVEPVSIILIGLIVGFIVSSVFLTINYTVVSLNDQIM